MTSEVRSGETLYELCRKHQVSLAQLVCFNADLITRNMRTEPGLKLVIPPRNMPLPNKPDIFSSEEY